jgi:hypothetical protein
MPPKILPLPPRATDALDALARLLLAIARQQLAKRDGAPPDPAAACPKKKPRAKKPRSP